MQRIIVKNFLGVKEVDIKIGKVLVLIGEQASGKSTLAKLIYFFQTIQEDIFNIAYTDQNQAEFKNEQALHKFIHNKFYNFFGSTKFWDSFEVSYSYDHDKIITLSIADDNKRLEVQIAPSFQKEIIQTYQSIVSNPFSNLQKLLFPPTKLSIPALNKIHESLVQLFKLKQVNSLYTIAGRNATVSYSDLFEKYLFSSLERAIEKNRTAKPFSKKQNTDEILMLKFIKYVDAMKETLDDSGGIEGILEEQKENDNLLLANKKIENILKGKYFQNIIGEQVQLLEGFNKSILLKNASSGQQESIRILQDLFLIIADGRPVMRIFEEPEAHLFPIAQKEIIELMALTLNSTKDSSIIITTHSPYILSAINNLLFAGQVASKQPHKREAIQAVVNEKFWLQPEDVNAYSLGNSYTPDRKYFEDIFDKETGIIDQNYLDTVSELLGEEFYQLIEINNQ